MKPATGIPLQKDCFVTTLVLMGLRALGPESLDWEPEILRDAFESYYGIEKLPQRSFDRLNAGYTLIGTNTFTNSIEGFLACTSVMNGHLFDESEAPYCDLNMCAWSVWEYMNLLGDMKDARPTEEFDEDVKAYIREAAKVQGMTRLPQWLSFAELDDAGQPDMTGDVSLFEMYNARQNDYINDIVASVTARQRILAGQLKQLKEMKILG